MDSGADSSRIDSANDRSISDSRAVCGGWSRAERAHAPAVRGGGSPDGGLRRDRGSVAGDGDRAKFHRPWSEGPERPRLTGGRSAQAWQRSASTDGDRCDTVGRLALVAVTGDQGRPDAAAASLAWLFETHQAGSGAVRDGASGQQE